MNLQNQTEVAEFLDWVTQTEGASVASQCEEKIRAMIVANQTQLAQPLELVWRAQDKLCASEIADASDIARSPFDSRLELD